ncbi:hypothetical protein ACQPW3_24345 [Actinosynnema sp. CA-248983]
MTTRTIPSARVLDTSQPGGPAHHVPSARSTGSGSSTAVHTGWSAGRARPSIPLAAQYGEDGPE